MVCAYLGFAGRPPRAFVGEKLKLKISKRDEFLNYLIKNEVKANCCSGYARQDDNDSYDCLGGKADGNSNVVQCRHDATFLRQQVVMIRSRSILLMKQMNTIETSCRLDPGWQ